jgi:hypothetical protein
MTPDQWIERYRRAWETADGAESGSLTAGHYGSRTPEGGLSQSKLGG